MEPFGEGNSRETFEESGGPLPSTLNNQVHCPTIGGHFSSLRGIVDTR